MTSTPLRADAARSRDRILAAARRADPKDLRLNEVAREAGVGVGTVYRHFATAHALVEELTRDALERLNAIAVEAAAHPDPGHAFETALRAVVDLHLESGGLQAVLLAEQDMSPEVTELKAATFDGLRSVLERAQRAGAVRADLSGERVERLVCGIEYAIRLSDADDRAVFVDVLLAGLRPRP
ncbi:TetR/AcrR family transcriptional regulator [Nocardiopsis sp. CC223A]|uniref:TetR/AcrR family transcriptional regulator n=1 Tax=Nocardiopsis sp. CC223A TaxID=3044051 RepID=UPI00278C6108|nr:TetR/AcrR family transcriptional regulator [Nocardiopsis sp. CC223A]